jgi:hypothetical protein
MSDDGIDEQGLVKGTLVPARFLQGFGLVSVAYSRMDEQLNYTIWHLAGLSDEIGMSITALILNINTRVQVFRRLVDIVVPVGEDKENMLVLAGAMEDAIAIRNRFTHDELWAHSTKNGLEYFRQDQWLKERPPTYITEESLRDLGNKFIRLAGRLQQIRFLAEEGWAKDGPFP